MIQYGKEHPDRHGVPHLEGRRSGFKGAAINEREEKQCRGRRTGRQHRAAFDLSTPEAKIRAQLYEKNLRQQRPVRTLVEDDSSGPAATAMG